MIKVATIIDKNNKKFKIYFDKNGNFNSILTGICNFKIVSETDKERFQNILNKINNTNEDPKISINKDGRYRTEFNVDGAIVYIYSKNHADTSSIISKILNWTESKC